MLRDKDGRVAKVCFEALSVMALTVSCQGPAPPSPTELARAVASARAAAAAASAVGSAAPAAPLAPPPPVLSLQVFKAEPPSSACSPAKVASCALDNVGGAAATDVVPVKRDQDTPLIGWAADVDSGTVPPVILLELVPGNKKAKKFYASMSRITKRPDVAEVTKSPAFVDAGYDLLASFKDVDVGEYVVNVLQVNVAGNSVTCDTRRKLKVE